MRFHLGAIPENESFDPVEDGWRGIREPDPRWLQLLVLPVIVVVGALVVAALAMLTEIDMVDVIEPLPLLVFFAASIAPHELLHALAHPKLGLSGRTILGLWPSRLLFFAHYDGPVPRNRFLAILLAPFVGLTLVPLLFAMVTRCESPVLGCVVLTNAVASSGDLLGVPLLVLQIPRTAVVQNKGWRSYWKEVADETA